MGANGAEACSLVVGSTNCTDAPGDDISGAGPAVGLEIGESSVSTTGAGAYGLYSFGQGSSATARDSLIETSGAGAHGLVARNGGNVLATGATIATSGEGAAAAFALSGTAAAPNTITVSGGTLTSALGDLVRAEGAALDIAIQGGTVTGNGSGRVLNSLDNQAGNHSLVNLISSNIILNGDIFVDTDNVGNVTLLGSELTGAAYNATNINIDASSRWNMSASSTVSQLTKNAGVINFAPPTGDPTLIGSYKTLTTSDYTGANGTVGLNTYLGEDASPSDRLVIDGGTATGSTSLAIRNTTGPGALTLSDGIRVVDAINGASTAAGAFSLLGDFTTEDGQSAVIGGAYAYTLHHNGIIDPADGDWYLRSTLTMVPPVDPEQPDEPPVDPEQPDEPRYAAGVPVYEAYPQVLQVLNGVPTLQQRVGNRYWKETPPPAEPVFCKDPARNFRCAPTAEQNAAYADGVAQNTVDQNGVWGRIEGSHSRFRPDVTTSSTNYDVDVYKMQAGIDGLFHEGEKGRLLGGFNVLYAHGKADVSSFFGDGEISTDGYGVGGTLTWYGNNGFYLDAQAQAVWYQSDLTSLATDITRPGLANGNDGFGYALSLEAGKRYELSEGWSLTPQAQLVWSVVDFDSFNDPYGARVSLDSGDSLQGRLGISVEKQASWTDADGQIARSHIYGIANLYNEFLDGSRVNVAGVAFDSRNDRLWGGVGLGGSYNWANDKYSVYGEGSVNTSLNNFADSYALKGTVGFKVKF